jgi:hypothetical protein
MLRDFQRHAETVWHESSAYPGMGYWGTGRTADVTNATDGPRVLTATALVYALLYNLGYREFTLKDRVEPALRYAAATYIGGPAKGTDGKQWGHSWQSRMYAGNLGVAAWLVRDELAPDVMALVKACVATEADRLIATPPPDIRPGDTRAEENAWDLTAGSAALLLMPDHAHAPRWREAVIRYAVNTMAVPADRRSKKMVDGKPLREWVTTAQYYADFTTENHGVFHPVYAMVAPATLAQAAVAFRLAGQPVPDALNLHAKDVFGTLLYIAQDDGEWLYPQGLDWELHDYEHIHFFAQMATLFQDPTAALLEKRTLDAAMRRQCLNGDGAFVGPTSSIGYMREAVQAERVAFAFLMHRHFGPAPDFRPDQWRRTAGKMRPARAFEQAGFVVHRTKGGLASFSWKNHLMGLAQPQSETHLDRPCMTTPNTMSLVGRAILEGQPRSDAGKVAWLKRAVNTGKDGFVVAVDSGPNNGMLRQQLAVSSVAPGVMAYVDRVTAMQDLTITEELGLPVAIENDMVSGNRRALMTDSGAQSVVGGTGKDIVLSGGWVNVDSRLGVVVPDAAFVYRAAADYNRPGAREDLLFGRYSAERRLCRAGEVVAQRAMLLLLDAGPEETAKTAASVRFRDINGTLRLAFTGPDGRAHTLSLAADGTATWDAKKIVAR